MKPTKIPSSEAKKRSQGDTTIFRVVLWTIFFFLVYGAQQLTSWPLIAASGWRGDFDFADLRSVLRAASCSKQIGWDIYDPNKWGDCGYIYGTLLIRAIHLLDLNPELTIGIGWFFIFLFSALCGYILSTLSHLSRLQQLMCVLILVSPGSMLLLERGNFDVVLILLLASAAICFWKNRILTGFAFISLSALFKFYTLPLIFLVLFQLKERKRLAAGIIASGLVTFLVLRDLVLIRGEFPNNLMGSFGNQIPSLYLDYVGVKISRFYGEMIGFLSLVAMGAIIWYFLKKKLSLVVDAFDLRHKFTLSQLIQLLFICTFLICFFAGVNYDYRIPYLTIPCVLFLGTLHRFKINLWIVLVPLFVAAWASFNVGWLQVFGDFALLSLTSTILLLGSLLSKKIFDDFKYPTA